MGIHGLGPSTVSDYPETLKESINFSCPQFLRLQNDFNEHYDHLKFKYSESAHQVVSHTIDYHIKTCSLAILCSQDSQKAPNSGVT